MPGLIFIDVEAWEVRGFRILFLYSLVSFLQPLLFCAGMKLGSRSLGGLPGLTFIDLEAWEARAFRVPFWYLF